MTKQEEIKIEVDMWAVVEDETTDGAKCFVAYDLMRKGCMAQGKTPEEAFISFQSAKLDWDGA